MQEQPLIMTLKMDEESQAFFDAKRKQYFPPERNFLKAHIILFHQLPDDANTHDFLASHAHKPFTMKVTGLMNLGAGVAYRIESKELNFVHQELSKQFQDTLIPQDRQGYRPHITIMNKTTPEIARNLIAELTADFKPFNIQAAGLDLWTYLGGPWEHKRTIIFD